MLELGPAGVHPVQVLVHRELRERLPGRLVAVNVHRVNSVRWLVTNWKGGRNVLEMCLSLYWDIKQIYLLKGIVWEIFRVWAYLERWPSWGYPAYLRRPIFSRPETREWLESSDRRDGRGYLCVSENKHQVTRSRFAHKEDIWALYWVSSTEGIVVKVAREGGDWYRGL